MGVFLGFEGRLGFHVLGELFDKGCVGGEGVFEEGEACFEDVFIGWEVQHIWLFIEI